MAVTKSNISNTRVGKNAKNGKKTKKMKMMPVLAVDKVDLVALELKFVKRLAGNDPRLSEKEVKKLGKWLRLRSNGSNPFTDQDIIHLWKGLYFCMWMSDKPLIQEKLAENLASLLHCFDKTDVAIQFYGAFLTIMGIEWIGIDQWRIDKFMMLVRRVTRQCFVVLHKNKWDKKHIKQLNECIEKTILDKSSSMGFIMHFTEIILEEIAKVSLGKISKLKITLLIQPFAKCIAVQRDGKIAAHIMTHIFDALLYQSDLGREYKEKFEAWKSMGFPGTSIEDLENVDEDEDSENDGNKDDDSQDDAHEYNGKISHLDPRAGQVDVVMPEIPFDPVDIIKKLEQYKHEPNTNVKGRRLLKRVIERYSVFANGKFPLGVQYMKINEEAIDLPDIDDKVREMIDFEEDLYQPTREMKKLNKKKRKKALTHVEVQPKKAKLSKEEELKPKKKKYVNSWVETDLTPEEIPVNVSQSNNTSFNGSNSKDDEMENVINSTTGPFTVNEGWNAPLKDGEVEYFISRNNVKKRIKEANEKLSSDNRQTNLVLNPMAVLDKKPKVTSTSTSTPTVPLSVSTPIEKKVKIMLDLNRSQDTSEYYQQLKSSPQIPYDSAKKPGKGLLKPHLVPSPINPNYKKKLGQELTKIEEFFQQM